MLPGAETVAHLRENGRITILFHAFEGPARIVRLYGKGEQLMFLGYSIQTFELRPLTHRSVCRFLL